MNQNIIQILITFVSIIIQLLQFTLFISILMSWFAGPTRTQFGMYVEYITRTLTAPFKFARIGMFDFSILIVYVLLNLGGKYIINLLQTLA